MKIFSFIYALIAGGLELSTHHTESINGYDLHGMTPLLTAVFVGDVDVVRKLLANGADPNKPQRDDVTATPLWHAQEDFGLLEIADLLREHGARLA